MWITEDLRKWIPHSWSCVAKSSDPPMEGRKNEEFLYRRPQSAWWDIGVKNRILCVTDWENPPHGEVWVFYTIWFWNWEVQALIAPKSPLKMPIFNRKRILTLINSITWGLALLLFLHSAGVHANISEETITDLFSHSVLLSHLNILKLSSFIFVLK